MKAIQKCFFVLLLCSVMGCTTNGHRQVRSNAELRANYLVTAADDFIVDVYLNGVRVPDDRRELLEEIHGATVERINVQVFQGDWLVFHVVNNRLRWGGSYYFGAAGVLWPNEFGFVSETESGNWSACDNPANAIRFVQEKPFLRDDKAQPISSLWTLGTPQMKKFAGDNWAGEPLWGLTRDTWLKVDVQ
ncbi:hypothetical protein GC207_08475 [bacterium]|nr:hypothetical protein [bacterium]